MIKFKGVAMGLPLSPLFPKIFLSYHEQNLLRNCPVYLNLFIIDVKLMTALFCSNQKTTSLPFLITSMLNTPA